MNTLFLKSNDIDLITAAEILKSGGLVAIPTETVYGLAANALDGNAVSKIFAAKGRPVDNPLIVHISSLSEWEPLVEHIPEKAKILAEKFWPGPLTIILPKSDIIPKATSGGLSTVGVRMPSHPVARKIIELSGCPLAAPSANSSGLPSPTVARHVIKDMAGRIDAVVDGGECDFGIESTVISLASDPPRLFRPGGITVEQIEAAIGKIEIDPAVLNGVSENEKPLSPGMKYKHYSPKAEIFIVSGSLQDFVLYTDLYKKDGDMALCFSGEEKYVSIPCLNFGSRDNPKDQAHALFYSFRCFDELGAKRVFVREPSSEGIGLGVYNRLLRAAEFKRIFPMRVYGLTGPTGSGKGFVSELLGKKNYLVIDTDRISHNVTSDGSPAVAGLCSVFGEEIKRPDGSLDRKLLAGKAFSSEESRQKLNAVVHPYITAEILRIIKENDGKGYKAVFLDAPVLFDTELPKYCTKIVTVSADEQTRLKRIINRDRISLKEAGLRVKAQMSDREYREKADIVIRNYRPYDIKEEIERMEKLL